MGLRLCEFTLREKTDKHGKKYLFGSIPEYNLVALIFDDTPAGSEEKSFTFCLKPYSGAASADEYGKAWRAG